MRARDEPARRQLEARRARRRRSDSDGDGLLNGWERRGWGTDPAKVDSDGDGKGDCKEAFDVTGDGVLNFPGDTITIAKAANNIIAKSIDFDVNKDGAVNFPGDAIASATRANGIIPCLVTATRATP